MVSFFCTQTVVRPARGFVCRRKSPGLKKNADHHLQSFCDVVLVQTTLPRVKISALHEIYNRRTSSNQPTQCHEARRGKCQLTSEEPALQKSQPYTGLTTTKTYLPTTTPPRSRAGMISSFLVSCLTQLTELLWASQCWQK